MNVADLAGKIDARYPCVQGLFAPYCQTREKYVALGFEEWHPERRLEYAAVPLEVDHISGPAIEGIVREFAPRRSYETEAEGCEDLFKAFDLYAERWWQKHGGLAKPVLYWRYAAPHIFLHHDERRGRVTTGLCRIRTRLVLSNAPIVFANQDAYDVWRAEQETDHGRPSPQQTQH
jgi:hypothetical protein